MLVTGLPKKHIWSKILVLVASKVLSP